MYLSDLSRETQEGWANSFHFQSSPEGDFYPLLTRGGNFAGIEFNNGKIYASENYKNLPLKKGTCNELGVKGKIFILDQLHTIANYKKTVVLPKKVVFESNGFYLIKDNDVSFNSCFFENEPEPMPYCFLINDKKHIVGFSNRKEKFSISFKCNTPMSRCVLLPITAHKIFVHIFIYIYRHFKNVRTQYFPSYISSRIWSFL